MNDKSNKTSQALNYEEIKQFHKKKNDLFVDILSFFAKEPESFYMFPDELIDRLRKMQINTIEYIQKIELLKQQNSTSKQQMERSD